MFWYVDYHTQLTTTTKKLVPENTPGILFYIHKGGREGCEGRVRKHTHTHAQRPWKCQETGPLALRSLFAYSMCFQIPCHGWQVPPYVRMSSFLQSQRTNGFVPKGSHKLAGSPRFDSYYLLIDLTSIYYLFDFYPPLLPMG